MYDIYVNACIVCVVSCLTSYTAMGKLNFKNLLHFMTANHLELCAYFRCFVFRCGFVLVNFIYVIQGNLTDASYHCSGATEATLKNIGKYII